MIVQRKLSELPKPCGFRAIIAGSASTMWIVTPPIGFCPEYLREPGEQSDRRQLRMLTRRYLPKKPRPCSSDFKNQVLVSHKAPKPAHERIHLLIGDETISVRYVQVERPGGRTGTILRYAGWESSGLRASE